jgi:hypothetical protein
MQDCLGRTMSEQLDDFTHSVEAPTLPAPAKAPGDFLVRIGEGWGGPLHELADGMRVWERGPAAAAGVLLSW